LVTDKALKSLDVTNVINVTAKNNDGPESATRTETPAPGTHRNGEPGLSASTIGQLAHWFYEEGDRRRNGLDLDRNGLDRDLRRRLAKLGVPPECIPVEFERVMVDVFAPSPWLRTG
jgi:hypothetical protein